jgi:uncharacterized protein with HEPN domain
MTGRDPHLYLDDILEGIDKIRRHAGGMSFEQFYKDEVLQAAVIRWIEVIGEAAAHITPEIRARDPDIPWQDIAGTRNLLIHGYFRVDLARVWHVVTGDLSDLHDRVTKLQLKLDQ